jgi:hypothetical protein
MKVAISLGAPYAADIKDIQLENQMIYVVEAERLGAKSAWSAQVQDLWLQGQRKAASALIPDELCSKPT